MLYTGAAFRRLFRGDIGRLLPIVGTGKSAAEMVYPGCCLQGEEIGLFSAPGACFPL